MCQNRATKSHSCFPEPCLLIYEVIYSYRYALSCSKIIMDVFLLWKMEQFDDAPNDIAQLPTWLPFELFMESQFSFVAINTSFMSNSHGFHAPSA